MGFLNTVQNFAHTKNGALSHKSSMSACLDLFSMGVTADEDDKYALIKKAWDECPLTATKVVFALRDCRGGQGNKNTLRTFNKFLKDIGFAKFRNLFQHYPQIGSWKDVYDLYNLTEDEEILKFVDANLNSDGLAAKWFPRQSKFHKDFAKFRKQDVGSVRREVAALTKVVETQMCNKLWGDVVYESVPSCANKKYAKAFSKNDEKRYSEFLTKAVSGEVKINSGQLYPHEIVGMVGDSPNTADALWKGLPNFLASAKNVLPIIDVSGSMTTIAYSKYTCMDIAIGLGIYFAEHNTGAYKDVWCNFSTTPNFYKLTGSTLLERVRTLDYQNWGGSTDIQAVFDLILKGYKENPVAEDLPKTILIVSDMEFNNAGGNCTNFEEAQQKFAAHGLYLPTIVFWRVDTKNIQQPVTIHQSGAVLINGYSPAIMGLVCAMDEETIKSITPLSIMLQAIEKYNYLNI
jgi:hypothetical protein